MEEQKRNVRCSGKPCRQEREDRCQVWLNRRGEEMLSRPEEAILYFKRAIALAPDYAEARNHLGTAYGLCGRH